MSLSAKDKVEVILRYKKIVEGFPEDIRNNKKVTAQAIMEHLDISREPYYRRIKEGSFKLEEIEKIAELLWPHEYQEVKKYLETSPSDNYFLQHIETLQHIVSLAAQLKEKVEALRFPELRALNNILSSQAGGKQ